jgi:hypothetical protein
LADQNGEDVEKSKKGEKVVIIHDKSTSGNGLPDETRKAMNANGVTEVLYKSINIGEKVYSANGLKPREPISFTGAAFTRRRTTRDTCAIRASKSVRSPVTASLPTSLPCDIATIRPKA